VRIAYNARLILNESREGLALYTLEILRQLLLTTDHEYILLTDRVGELPELPREVERAVVYPSARHPVLFYTWFEWAVPRALRRTGADAFISLDNFCSLRTKVPTLLAVHDLAYRHVPEGVGALQLAFYRRYMPRFVRRADRLIAVSEATRADIVRSYSVPAEAIAVVPNGVRGVFGRLTPKQVSDAQTRFASGNPYFIYVGSVYPRKNVARLVRAFSRFKAETGLPHHLIVAGRIAWQSEGYRQALEDIAFRDCIVETGYLSDADLALAIGGAKALAMVSLFEGFGVPIVEALQSGVPVLVSDRSSLPEVAGPGGLQVNPEDETAIAEALGRLATDAELRQVLAKAGAEHIAKYTWEKSGAIVADVLNDLLASST